MTLGTFSISLTVKDLCRSREFYEKIGFDVFAGSEAQNYLIMKNGDTNIGLFQGMFDKNILTFNPGWNSDAEPISEFRDIREIHQQFIHHGLNIESGNFPTESGPASFTVTDPDGNPILFDQHV